MWPAGRAAQIVAPVVAPVVVACLLLFTAACASPEPGGSTSSTVVSTSGPTTETTGGGAILEATTVVQGLRIPWEMRFLPDGRLLLTEREGRVVVADVTTGTVAEVGRIDVLARGEGGLMGMALDPEFPTSPYIYVSFTHEQTGESANRVSRFELTGFEPGQTLALGAETVLLDGIPAGSNHDGSRVAFGPDGYLWVTTGDSGEGGLAQDPESLAGKVLRMTKDGQPAPDNPFLDKPYPLSLVYSLGHRNPQGLDFHPLTGLPYITEHGPSDNDEVNLLRPGGNYGWPDLRGVAAEPGFEDPLMTWTPTIAPAGALFYMGDRLGDLQGAFLFVTLKESDLRALIPTEAEDFAAVAEERVLFDEEFGRLRAIAQGPDGALYIATSNHDGRGDPEEGDDRVIRIVDRD